MIALPEAWVNRGIQDASGTLPACMAPTTFAQKEHHGQTEIFD
jgi:hypothetical protein